MSREELIKREEVEYGEKFKDFIRNYRDETGRFKYMDRLRRMINYNQISLLIEFSDLYRYDTTLAEDLVENPVEVLKEASEAIRELVSLEDPEYAEKKGRFIPRILGLFETMSIRDLRSEHVGKLVQIDGIITRMHPIRSRLVKARFRHEKCKAEFDWPQDEDEVIGDRIEKPTICPACGEGGGKFILLQDKSKYIDWQKIVVQERPEDVPGGQMPRGIEVHLVEDLVDIARPGDRITIVGIPRLEQTRSVSPLFELYIEANSVRVSEKVLEEVSISREDEEAIRELALDPWIREKIIASIAPSIYGQWDLKEAIALLLFSGIPKTMPDGTRIRGDIHVLFIGDPGVAKSQLLQSASRIAPRAVFTSGKGSTAAGLTAAVIQDKKTGEYYLEAGALVLADGGVAIIDEFDKMRAEDRVAIHEAMEQQSYHWSFEIMLSNGLKLPIGMLVDGLMEKYKDKVVRVGDTEILNVDGLYLMAYDLESRRIVNAKASRVSRHKAPGKIVRLYLSNGRTLLVTPEHPIMVWENGEVKEKPAIEVGKGDVLIGVRQYDLPSRLFIETSIAELAGLLLSGKVSWSYRHDGRYVEFYVRDPVIMNKLVDIFKSLNVTYCIDNANTHSIRLHSEEVSKILKSRSAGLLDLPSSPSKKHVRLPYKLMLVKREAKAAFLRAYIVANGIISDRGVVVVAFNRGMAEDIQDLLLSLGVYSRVEVVANCNHPSEKCYSVIVDEELSLAKLIELGIIADPKLPTRNEGNSESSQIPAVASAESRVNWEEVYANRGSTNGLLVMIDSPVLYGRNAEAPATISVGLGGGNHGIALDYAGSGLNGKWSDGDATGSVVNGNMMLLHVVDVEVVSDDSMWVYDVTVEPYHLFVSHGIILHNSISISKAGIVARLNARASVLAAGNPKYGLYDPTRSFTDNVNLPPTILSRFDLIFVVRDIVNMERDRELARYILEAHSDVDKFKPEIDPQLLKKYIIYARRYVRPKLTPQAKKLIEDFFVEMRGSALQHTTREEGQIPIPITARQLEAIVRLAEAHAKMALKDSVTEEDAEEAIRITSSFLESVGLDMETGTIDVGIIMTGASFHTRKLMSMIVDEIKRLIEAESRRCVKEDEIVKMMTEATKASEEKVRDAIRRLYQEGIIYMVKTDCYRVA